MSLDSPRYFRLASRLHHYDGALRHALVRDYPQQPVMPGVPGVVPGPGYPGAGFPGAGHEPVQQVDDLGAVVAMTNDDPRFPGIEYDGG